MAGSSPAMTATGFKFQTAKMQTVIASGAKQSIVPRKESWIASLRSQ
jgi:hypothetical protein